MTDHSKLNISLNIILGFIMGYLLYITILDPTVVRGPNSKDIVDKVYIHNGKKYEFVPKIYPSPIKLA